MSAPVSPQIVQRMYDLLLYLLSLVSKFPRSQRYTLGERIQNLSFDILELLLDALYSREKLPLLHKINIQLDKFRHYLRLSKDLKFVSLHQYEVLSKRINEIGVQLGGWIRHQQGKK